MQRAAAVRRQRRIRHGRACAGHPRLCLVAESKTWMPATSAGMTWRGFGERLVSIEREHEQVARGLELVELDRMQVAAARLHREILLGSDRVGHRRALERRADVEAPELLQRLVVVGNHPAVL